MRCLLLVVLYHALFAGGLVYAHFALHGVWSPLHAALAVFETLNAWICVCEIALLVHSRTISEVHKDSEAKLGVGRLPPVFLFEEVTLAQALSLRYWSEMWSTYAALDPSYAEPSSFGFCVDVGNGVSTIVPTVLFAVGMTWPIMPARLLGMMGLVVHYQEFYGTCIYFFSYFFNQRYKRTTKAHVLGIVVPANAIWMVFPSLGMWASAQLILSGDFTLFR
ncbi:hypothetical protein AB1Y20_020162 [Prymnesium parvum]|uniref:Uncharacterized protein n=1 Tax=Prymnesium parvum TaxID=97485 RepID=A0AB34JTX1_PRYPA